MSVLSSIVTEQQIIHFCLDYPERILDIKDNYFLSTEGHDIYGVLLDLYRENIGFSNDNIVSLGNKVNQGITAQLLDTIRKSQYDINGWEHYLRLLREAYAKDTIQTKLLKEAVNLVSIKGDLDIKGLQDVVNDIQNNLCMIENSGVSIKTIPQMFDSYQNALSKRLDGTAFYPTGCSLLDSALPTGFAPGEMTTIFGSTGIGKSTYSLYLINRMINKSIPCLYVSLEMSETATMDRWMASRIRIPLSQLYAKGGAIEDSVYERVVLERNKLEHNKKFAFVDETRMTVMQLEKIIEQVKLKLRTNYLAVFVDLATMLEDFADGTPQAYEQAMNALHQMVKRTSIHLILIVQAVNKSLENHRPASVDGVNSFRPILASIKNSGAIAERSRQVLSVFRPHYYNAKFFPDDPLVAEESDVMEIQVLKCSNGEAGKVIKYLYDGPLFRVYPIPDDVKIIAASALRKEEAEETEDGEI